MDSTPRNLRTFSRAHLPSAALPLPITHWRPHLQPVNITQTTSKPSSSWPGVIETAPQISSAIHTPQVERVLQSLLHHIVSCQQSQGTVPESNIHCLLPPQKEGLYPVRISQGKLQSPSAISNWSPIFHSPSLRIGLTIITIVPGQQCLKI